MTTPRSCGLSHFCCIPKIEFSSDRYSTTWSCLSALSLSDVSDISVINLAITVEEDHKLLSKALEKANHAVLLDNAENFEGAIDEYTDACALLQQVMQRSSGEEDRKKLEAVVSVVLSIKPLDQS